MRTFEEGRVVVDRGEEIRELVVGIIRAGLAGVLLAGAIGKLVAGPGARFEKRAVPRLAIGRPNLVLCILVSNDRIKGFKVGLPRTSSLIRRRLFLAESCPELVRYDAFFSSIS